jgi:hypothetical protein
MLSNGLVTWLQSIQNPSFDRFRTKWNGALSIPCLASVGSD